MVGYATCYALAVSYGFVLLFALGGPRGPWGVLGSVGKHEHHDTLRDGHACWYVEWFTRSKPLEGNALEQQTGGFPLRCE